MGNQKTDYSDFDFSLFIDEELVKLEKRLRKIGDEDFADAVRKELERRGVKLEDI